MTRRLLLILLAALLSFPLLAQKRDRFDEALDRYELIGARCLVLRDALDRGEPIPQTELRTLLEQIASLRQTLSEATGEMSPAQRSASPTSGTASWQKKTPSRSRRPLRRCRIPSWCCLTRDWSETWSHPCRRHGRKDLSCVRPASLPAWIWD